MITDASLRSTSVTVTPSVTSTNVGASIGISGTLAFVNQATGVRTLNVTAAGPGGAQVDLGQVSTAADGSYSAQVAFPAAGTWTVTVAFAGDASHRASQATSTGLPVYKLRSRPGISLSKHIITYGQQITIRIQLKHWHTNRTVELTRKTVGKPRVSLGIIDVGPTGIVTLTVKPKANSTYRADWAGDDWYAAGHSNEPPVDVHALVRDGIAGGYAVRSGVHLIHYHSSCPTQGRSCPIVHGTVLPNYAGKPIYFTLQVRANGSWHTFATAHFRIPSSGTKSAGLVYRNRSVIGLLQRFRADFGGDADHLRGRGRWVKFMVTG